MIDDELGFEGFDQELIYLSRCITKLVRMCGFHLMHEMQFKIGEKFSTLIKLLRISDIRDIT